jgi:hypothetical protein
VGEGATTFFGSGVGDGGVGLPQAVMIKPMNNRKYIFLWLIVIASIL